MLRFGTPAAEPRLDRRLLPRVGRRRASPSSGRRARPRWRSSGTRVAARVAILDAAPVPRGEATRRSRCASTARRSSGSRSTTRATATGSRCPRRRRRPGDNRLRFVFAAHGLAGRRRPEEPRPAAARRRPSTRLVTGPSSDASLEDLLGRDAPRPFAVSDEKGVPALTLVGPAVVRFALQLPPSAELRFTPELLPAARAAAGAASFRVTVEGRRRRRARGLERGSSTRARRPPGEQVVRLPGTAGDIVRIGLAVGPARAARASPGAGSSRRGSSAGGGDPLQPAPVSPADDARADAAARAAGRRQRRCSSSSTPGGPSRSGPTATRAPTTPEIDRIASEGVVFERVYTPAVYTLGAMSSVWTSQYPDRHHSEVSFSARLPKDRLTLAELLSAQGIHTGGLRRQRRGRAALRLRPRLRRSSTRSSRTLGSRGDVFRQVVPAVAARRTATVASSPTSTSASRTSPTTPSRPSTRSFGPDGPIPKADAARREPFFQDVNQGRRPFSEAEREHLVRLYDGNLAFADQEVGRAAPRRSRPRACWEKTVVIVAADHGEELLEHGWIGHNVQLYEPSVHVPLDRPLPEGHGARGRAGAGARGPARRRAHDRRRLRRARQGRLRPRVPGPQPAARDRWARRASPRCSRARSGTARATRCATSASSTSTTRAPARSGSTTSWPTRARRATWPAEEPLRAAYYRQALHAWTLQLARRGPAGSGAGRAHPRAVREPEGARLHPGRRARCICK